MKTRHLHRPAQVAALAALVALGEPAPLAAQPEPATCARSAAAATAPGAEMRNLHALARCPESRPLALLALWSRSPLSLDEGELTQLAKHTGRTRDERLYSAVMGVATSPSRPTADRLQALRVLFYYHVPGLMPVAEYLTLTSRPYYVPLSSNAHDYPYPTSRPLPPGRTPQYPALLFRLSTDDPDPMVRLAAARLRQMMVFQDSVNTPIPAGAIQLISTGCGGLVQIHSNADIELMVRIQVLGTTFDDVRGVDGPWHEGPRPTLALPPGVVVASFAGRELARLVDRGPPCPPR